MTDTFRFLTQLLNLLIDTGSECVHAPSYSDTTLPPSGRKRLLQYFKTNLYFFSPFFPLASQNGQTALSVAEGGSHQDILDLLKAGSQPPSDPDLLWAAMTTFTFCRPLQLAGSKLLDLPLPRPPTERKKPELRTVVRNGRWRRWLLLLGIRTHWILWNLGVYTLLATCPLSVYGYAAPTTQWPNNRGSWLDWW